MKKVLFLIHDLGQGGAEKVLVNLVNNMDKTKFDITVIALFGGGVNEQFLRPEIHYISLFKWMIPGNSKIMKLCSPSMLHRLFIREQYDIEISYLEGPSARIISGCQNSKTNLVSWIHVEQHTIQQLASSFRSQKEAIECYNRFDQTICVSQYVHDDFCGIIDYKKKCNVLYNTVESQWIVEQSQAEAKELQEDGLIRLIAVGTLKESKGYDRLLRIAKMLRNRVHLYILGAGPLQGEMEKFISAEGLESTITLLGYNTNPYKYVAKCDLFVCASHSEGFSTAATEALIVGTPVCTVEVSGMKEMLGENNEYGVVTDNSEDALFEGIRNLIDNPELLAHYKKQAQVRGKLFSTENTVRAVEEMLLSL